MSYFEELSSRNETDENDSNSTDSNDTNTSCQSYIKEHNDDLENEPYTILLKHIRCCAHTLSLCATSDIIKAIKSSSCLHEIHNQVIQKCNVLWNAAIRPKSAEVIQSILGHTLSRPGEKRWNSVLDSLSQINK